MNADKERQAAIIEQAGRLECEAYRWSEAQQSQAAWWRRWNTLLTTATGVLAAVAGATVLASSGYRVLAGVAALSAAALSAATSALGATARSNEYYKAAAINRKLSDDAGIFRTTVAKYVPLDEAVLGWDALREERRKAVEDAELKLGVFNLARSKRSSIGPCNVQGRQDAGAG
jgi:hypothetical protein